MAATDVAAVEPEMSAEEAMRLVARLALLGRIALDAPHGKLEHLRVVGFVIEVDEHYVQGEGVKMMHALQRLAEIDLHTVRTGILDRMEAPFDLAKILAEHAV